MRYNIGNQECSRTHVCEGFQELEFRLQYFHFPSQGFQELKFRESWNLRSLPEGLNNLASLERLRIYDYPGIRRLPKDGLPIGCQKMLQLGTNRAV